MKYKIVGNADCPIAEVSPAKGETVKLENGAMAYMAGIELSGKMNSKGKGLGGVLSAIGRSLTSGESMFITEATATADNACIGIAPGIPGKIACLKVGDKQYRLNSGSFLACDPSVNYVMKKQDLGKAFFGGTGGLFVMETEGNGDILVSAFGDLVELTVTPDRPMTIDNEHVVAWDSTLNYTIEVASGTFGFTTGEGLVNKFTGSGKVLIQTRNLQNLADAIQPFLPQPSSSSGN